jgi:hypothetical protein
MIVDLLLELTQPHLLLDLKVVQSTQSSALSPGHAAFNS